MHGKAKWSLLCLYIIISEFHRYYDGKKSPIYSNKAINYSAEDAVTLIFNAVSSVVCTEQPIGCHSTATFIVDISNLNHLDDIRADDLGAWKNCGVRSTYCSVSFDSSNKVCRVKKMGSAPSSVMRHSIYRLKRTYWQHSEESTFCRRLLEIEGQTSTQEFQHYSCYTYCNARNWYREFLKNISPHCPPCPLARISLVIAI